MLVEIVLFLLALVALLYRRFVNGTSYWAKRGIRQPEKPPPFLRGNCVFMHPDTISGKVIGEIFGNTQTASEKMLHIHDFGRRCTAACCLSANARSSPTSPTTAPTAPVSNRSLSSL